jgi:glutathione S-transferase
VSKLTLVSHHLCPYVQRAVIALRERQVPYERIDVDLADKPSWFNALSPLGKTPVLKAGEVAIFESAVILEYLEETQPLPLHPPDPVRRAEHRSWIEFGSATLNDIAGLYSAPDEASFGGKASKLTEKFAWLERRLGSGPYFDDAGFSLVDVVFGPVLPLLRRLRPYRRLRHSCRQAKGRRMAHNAGGKMVDPRRRCRGL